MYQLEVNVVMKFQIKSSVQKAKGASNKFNCQGASVYNSMIAQRFRFDGILASCKNALILGQNNLLQRLT